MFCKFCGKTLEDGAAFCKYCGKRLNETSAPSAAQPRPAPQQPTPPPRQTAYAPPPREYPPPRNDSYTPPRGSYAPAPPPQTAKPKRAGGFIALGLAVAALVGAVLFGLSKFGVFGGDDALVGKWSVSEVEYQGMTLSIEEFSEMAGRDVEIAFDFKPDGKVTVTGLQGGEGTYEADGERVDITIDGSTQTFAFSGGTLAFETQGVRMIMEKGGSEARAGGSSGGSDGSDGSDDSGGSDNSSSLDNSDDPGGSDSSGSSGDSDDEADEADGAKAEAAPASGGGIVGAWIEDGGTEYYEFKDDGTYSLGQVSDGGVKINFGGKYELNGSELMINYNAMSDELLGPLQVEFDGARMAITNEYERGKIWYVPYVG